MRLYQQVIKFLSTCAKGGQWSNVVWSGVCVCGLYSIPKRISVATTTQQRGGAARLLPAIIESPVIAVA